MSLYLKDSGRACFEGKRGTMHTYKEDERRVWRLLDDEIPRDPTA